MKIPKPYQAKLVVLCFLLIVAFINTHAQNKHTGKWEHHIQPGEKLDNISTNFGVSKNDILEVNKLNTENIDTLSTLKIPVAYVSRSAYKRKGNYLLHRIGKKEQLHQLAKRYQSNVAFLLKINNLRDNSLGKLKYLLVPNTMLLRRLSISRYFALGYYAGNDYTGKINVNYNFLGRVILNKETIKPPFRNVTRFHASLGYRHDIGEYFYKNIDRFEVRKQMSYNFSRLFSGFIYSSFRSQFLNSHLYYNGTKTMVSAPFAPAYLHFSIGPSFIGDSFNIDLSLYEFKTTFVSNNKLYEKKDVVFGVEQGQMFYTEHGVSLRADVYYFSGEKWNVQSNFYSFYNKNGFEMEFRGDLSYRLTRFLNLSIFLEAYYDPEVYDFFQFQNRISFGVSYHTRRMR